MKKALAYTVLFLLCYSKAFSSHIVGGEIFYDRLNDSTYRITLKVYRDCFNGGPPLDGVNDGLGFTPAILTVYTADSIFVGTYDIGAPIISPIVPTINNPCINPPLGICVEEGVYTYTLTLPPKTGGYHIIYQRCCRNTTVLNLFTLQGATYYTFIPGPEIAQQNNSPRYVGFPPIYICNNIPFTFDHKAIDPDGDQLVYTLCSPYQGLSNTCGSLAQPGCPTQAPPPPYMPIAYVQPYSSSYPIDANPSFTIHPSSGLLSGKPNTLGQFVVGVCVQEFRGNTLIGTHFRDFQFNVVNCIVQVASVFADQTNACEGSTITFTNQSFGNLGNLTYLWDFGDPTTNGDVSTAFSPSYTYPDTGSYVVTLIANPNKPCSDTIKKTVRVYPELHVNFPRAPEQCFKRNAFTFSAQGSYMPLTTFAWDFGSAAIPNTSTLTNPTNVSFSQSGKFPVLLVAKQITCIDSFIDTVKIIAPPVAKINNLPGNWCDPANITFTNSSISELPLLYEWLFSNGNKSTLVQPMQVFSPPGVYSATLLAKTNSVCLDTSIALVQNIVVNATPKAGFTFSPQTTTIIDPEITFTDSSSTDVTIWQYVYGDETTKGYPNDVHVYTDYGDYTVTQIVTNAYNCSDTIQQLVRILPEFRFWIPNAFSPDNNLLNDKFMPQAIGVVDYKFDVYSRWGELIFSTQNPKEGWNGSFEENDCQQDVYAWQIVFKNVMSSKREFHSGHVLLLRNK